MRSLLLRLPSFAVMAFTGIMASAVTPSPANAQFFYHPPVHRPLNYFLNLQRPFLHRPHFHAEELTPREIMAAVARQGFRDVSRPSYEDDIAIVTATARDGRRMRLDVDIVSGRIVDGVVVRPERRQLAQRAPEQGAAVRRAVPDQRRDVRSTPERPPTTIRREPLLPPQPQQATPPRATPPRLRQPAQQAPAAQPPAARAEPGTREQPRRIEMTPPAALDDVRPAPIAPPSGPPINSVPPAGLE